MKKKPSEKNSEELLQPTTSKNAFEAKILGIFTFNMLPGIQRSPAAAATTGGIVNRENTIRWVSKASLADRAGPDRGNHPCSAGCSRNCHYHCYCTCSWDLATMCSCAQLKLLLLCLYLQSVCASGGVCVLADSRNGFRSSAPWLVGEIGYCWCLKIIPDLSSLGQSQALNLIFRRCFWASHFGHFLLRFQIVYKRFVIK